jgi:dienelactone hydrolase
VIEGWLLKPENFDPSRLHPLVLEIHGGPHGQYGWAFFHELQMLAGMGYLVLYANPRGSDGYGERFRKEVVRDWGGKDYLDLMAAVDQLVERTGAVDTARMGVGGGSYGGYMTNWVIGHTDRFAAAVSMRSISNLVSEYAQHDIVIWGSLELGPPPWPNLDELWRRSPIRYVQDIKTPLLLTCGEMDLRCAISQSEELFGAMRLLGKTVELVRFPEESHDLSRGGRPDRRVERLRRIGGWFERFLGTSASDRPADIQFDTQVLATRHLAVGTSIEETVLPSSLAESQAIESEAHPEAIMLAPEAEPFETPAPALDAAPAGEVPEPAPVAQAPAVEAEAPAQAADWQATVAPAVEAEATAPTDDWQATVAPAVEAEAAASTDDWQATVAPAGDLEAAPIFPEPEPLFPQTAGVSAQPVAIVTQEVLAAEEPALPPAEPAPILAEPSEIAATVPPAPAPGEPSPDQVVETIIAWPRGTGPDAPNNGTPPAQTNTSEEATSIIPAWQPSDALPESRQTVSLQAMPPEVIASGGGYPAKLTFESGPFAGRIVALPNQMVTLGRAPDNDIVVGDPATSGRHGRIEVRGGAFWISDLGSTNGTLVNGDPVIEKQLSHGDLIAIGQNTIRFTLE